MAPESQLLDISFGQSLIENLLTWVGIYYLKSYVWSDMGMIFLKTWTEEQS